MTKKTVYDRTPTARPESEATASPVPRQGFERPALRKLGALPRVTAAFGGSFTP